MRRFSSLASVMGAIGQADLARFGNDRPSVQKVPFGLGEAVGPSTYERCMSCGFGNVPVVEEVIWTIPFPLLDTEIASTFGDIINLLTAQANVPGVGSIDSTFLINGILQTDLFLRGFGVHIFAEPQQFVALGNGFAQAQAPAGGACPANCPSPDVWTLNDMNNGAFPAGVTSSNFTPASLWWGGETWRAAWHMANAYQFLFKTSQRELVLNQQVADVAYFSSFADAEAAGTSEVPVTEYVQIVNAIYRAKAAAGSCSNIFLPANFRRYGSFDVGGSNPNIGLFHPTRDFDYAPTTWGGLKWTGSLCRDGQFYKVDKPCFLERGIPIGMQMSVNDPVHQALMQQAMSIDSSTGSCNLLPDINVSGFTCTGVDVMMEQTLDSSPKTIAQQVTVNRQIFKGGILKLAIKLKGWEMPGKWKQWCATNVPEVMGGAASGNLAPGNFAPAGGTGA